MNYLIDLAATLHKLDMVKLDALQALITRTKGTVWIAGNGGSAANALHWACDLSKAAGRRVQALGANPAVLTAWANDERYGSALAAELKAVARPDDSLICLSCSGTSENIVTLLRQAWLLKLPRALVTGQQMTWPTPIDVVVHIPHAHYGVLEDVTMAIGHYLTEQLRPDAAMPRRLQEPTARRALTTEMTTGGE